ncbi:MAG: M15 family metallopeptidase [Mollicutes bacterium]|nr:M15 family metallopeptidase [Mollicutes bacterium]
MAKRKLKKSVKLSSFLLILLLMLTLVGIKLYKNYQYRQTYEYKLLQINYTLDETKILIKNLNDNELEIILKKERNTNIIKFVSEKYFIFNNLDRYLEYLNKNENKEINNVITLVNVNRDRDYYKEPKATNIENKELMLVNKYHYLDENYTPEDIIKISLTYAYEGNSIDSVVYNAFKELTEDAKKEGHTIVINSSYRDYNSQKEIWESRKDLYGTRKADEYAARPGYSEHQTGYAIDVSDYYDVNDEFGKTDSFLWMKENCYKYGFILRYPEDKEDITGYSYEPWHYRYVGKDAALKIKNENITYDEYFAYYIENARSN